MIRVRSTFTIFSKSRRNKKLINVITRQIRIHFISRLFISSMHASLHRLNILWLKAEHVFFPGMVGVSAWLKGVSTKSVYFIAFYGLFFCPFMSQLLHLAHGELRYCFPPFVPMPSLLAYASALGEGGIVLRIVIDRA